MQVWAAPSPSLAHLGELTSISLSGLLSGPALCESSVGSILQKWKVTGLLHLLEDRDTIPTRSHSPFPLPQPLVSTKLPSVSMDLSVLGVSYKWNHTMRGLLRLAPFTQRNTFKAHLRYSMNQASFRCMADQVRYFFKSGLCS